MAIPTIVRSTDSGAPDLNGLEASCYNVLKFAMPLLGWTIAFDNATDKKIAFRNNAALGSGKYIQITDDDSIVGGDARKCKVKGYATMTALDTGTGEWLPEDAFFTKSVGLNSTATPWIIVGDDISAIFFCGLVDFPNTHGYRPYPIGDIDAFAPLDTAFMLAYGDSPAFSNNNKATLFETCIYGSDSVKRANQFIPSGLSNNKGNTSVGIDALFISASPILGSLSTSSVTFGTRGVYPERGTNKLLVSPLFVLDDEATDIDGYAYRGKLRGIFNPMHDLSFSGSQSGNHSFTNGQTIAGVSNGKGIADMLLVMTSTSDGNGNSDRFEGSLLIDITSDWSA